MSEMFYFDRNTLNLGRPFKARKRIWAKVVTEVDTTKDNGYAFRGEFLRVRGDPAYIDDAVPVGSFVVATSACGSTRHPATCITLFRVTAEGVEELWSGGYDTRAEMHTAIQEIAKIVNGDHTDDEVREKLKALINEYGIEQVKKILTEIEGGEKE